MTAKYDTVVCEGMGENGFVFRQHFLESPIGHIPCPLLVLSAANRKC